MDIPGEIERLKEELEKGAQQMQALHDAMMAMKGSLHTLEKLQAENGDTDDDS